MLPASLDIAQSFAQQPPELSFVLPGLVSGTVGALVSPGATGKSLFALEVAVAVASGVDILGIGMPPGTGRVLVVAAEDPAPVLWGRMHAIGAYLNDEQREAVIERLDVLPALSLGIDIYGEQSEAPAKPLASPTADDLKDLGKESERVALDLADSSKEAAKEAAREASKSTERGGMSR